MADAIQASPSTLETRWETAGVELNGNIEPPALSILDPISPWGTERSPAVGAGDAHSASPGFSSPCSPLSFEEEMDDKENTAGADNFNFRGIAVDKHRSGGGNDDDFFSSFGPRTPKSQALTPMSTPISSALGTAVTIPRSGRRATTTLLLGATSGGADARRKRRSREGGVRAPEPPPMSRFFAPLCRIHTQLQTGDKDATTEDDDNCDGLDGFEEGSAFDGSTMSSRSSLGGPLELLSPTNPGATKTPPHSLDSDRGIGSGISNDNNVLGVNDSLGKRSFAAAGGRSGIGLDLSSMMVKLSLSSEGPGRNLPVATPLSTQDALKETLNSKEGEVWGGGPAPTRGREGERGDNRGGEFSGLYRTARRSFSFSSTNPSVPLRSAFGGGGGGSGGGRSRQWYPHKRSGGFGATLSSTHRRRSHHHNEKRFVDRDVPRTIRIDLSLSVGDGEDIVTPLSLPKFSSPSRGVGATTAWRDDNFDVSADGFDDERQEWEHLRRPPRMHASVSMEEGDADGSVEQGAEKWCASAEEEVEITADVLVSHINTCLERQRKSTPDLGATAGVSIASMPFTEKEKGLKNTSDLLWLPGESINRDDGEEIANRLNSAIGRFPVVAKGVPEGDNNDCNLEKYLNSMNSRILPRSMPSLMGIRKKDDVGDVRVKEEKLFPFDWQQRRGISSSTLTREEGTVTTTAFVAEVINVRLNRPGGDEEDSGDNRSDPGENDPGTGAMIIVAPTGNDAGEGGRCVGRGKGEGGEENAKDAVILPCTANDNDRGCDTILPVTSSSSFPIPFVGGSWVSDENAVMLPSLSNGGCLKGSDDVNAPSSSLQSAGSDNTGLGAGGGGESPSMCGLEAETVEWKNDNGDIATTVKMGLEDPERKASPSLKDQEDNPVVTALGKVAGSLTRGIGTSHFDSDECGGGESHPNAFGTPKHNGNAAATTTTKSMAVMTPEEITDAEKYGKGKEIPAVASLIKRFETVRQGTTANRVKETSATGRTGGAPNRDNVATPEFTQVRQRVIGDSKTRQMEVGVYFDRRRNTSLAAGDEREGDCSNLASSVLLHSLLNKVTPEGAGVKIRGNREVVGMTTGGRVNDSPVEMMEGLPLPRQGQSARGQELPVEDIDLISKGRTWPASKDKYELLGVGITQYLKKKDSPYQKGDDGADGAATKMRADGEGSDTTLEVDEGSGKNVGNSCRESGTTGEKVGLISDSEGHSGATGIETPQMEANGHIAVNVVKDSGSSKNRILEEAKEDAENKECNDAVNVAKDSGLSKNRILEEAKEDAENKEWNDAKKQHPQKCAESLTENKEAQKYGKIWNSVDLRTKQPHHIENTICKSELGDGDLCIKLSQNGLCQRHAGGCNLLTTSDFESHFHGRKDMLEGLQSSGSNAVKPVASIEELPIINSVGSYEKDRAQYNGGKAYCENEYIPKKLACEGIAMVPESMVETKKLGVSELIKQRIKRAHDGVVTTGASCSTHEFLDMRKNLRRVSKNDQIHLQAVPINIETGSNTGIDESPQKKQISLQLQNTDRSVSNDSGTLTNTSNEEVQTQPSIDLESKCLSGSFIDREDSVISLSLSITSNERDAVAKDCSSSNSKQGMQPAQSLSDFACVLEFNTLTTISPSVGSKENDALAKYGSSSNCKKGMQPVLSQSNFACILESNASTTISSCISPKESDAVAKNCSNSKQGMQPALSQSDFACILESDASTTISNTALHQWIGETHDVVQKCVEEIGSPSIMEGESTAPGTEEVANGVLYDDPVDKWFQDWDMELMAESALDKRPDCELKQSPEGKMEKIPTVNNNNVHVGTSKREAEGGAEGFSVKAVGQTKYKPELTKLKSAEGRQVKSLLFWMRDQPESATKLGERQNKQYSRKKGMLSRLPWKKKSRKKASWNVVP